MQNTHDTPAWRWLFYVCCGALLWACTPMPASQERQHTTPTEDTTMNLARTIDTDTPTRPPIDMETPAVFETAAFGLG